MRLILLFSVLFLVSSKSVFAEVKVTTTGDSNVSIKQEVKGETTTCINGKCETTGGGGKATVCVNGKCYESDEENIDIKEDNTEVHINNSGSSVSVKSNNSNSSVDVKTESSNKIDKSTKSAEIEEEIKEKKETTKRFFETFIELLKKLLPFF